MGETDLKGQMLPLRIPTLPGGQVGVQKSVGGDGEDNIVADQSRGIVRMRFRNPEYHPSLTCRYSTG